MKKIGIVRNIYKNLENDIRDNDNQMKSKVIKGIIRINIIFAHENNGNNN